MHAVLIAESRGDPSDRLSHRHASLVSTCGSSSGAKKGNDVGLVTPNRGQWALPEEFRITVGGR